MASSDNQTDISEPWLELFKSAVEQTYDSVVITDATFDGGGPFIVFANLAFERITGYTRQEVLGRNPKFLQGPGTDASVIHRLRADLAAGRPFQGRTTNYRKDGTPFLMEWTISPMHNRDGVITHYVALQRDVTERQLMIDMLRHQAMIDGLTGIYNRPESERLLDAERDRSRRYDRDLAVLMLDIDNFKTVNDMHGHLVGDAVLKAFAARISRRLRTTDIIGRWGGEEFLVILPETDMTGAMVIAEDLRARVAGEPLAEGLTITASLGAAATRGGGSHDRLLAAADDALYRAKAQGRNTVAASDPLAP